MKKNVFVVRPLDIRNIRQSLNMTLEQMGFSISVHCRDIDNATFVGSRISEWEKGHRAVPDYVYRGTAYVVLDHWCDARHRVEKDKIPEVDEFYANLLSSTFGQLHGIEHKLSCSRSTADRRNLPQIRAVRRTEQRSLEQLLGVQIGYVYAVEPGGYDEDAVGEVL